MGTFIWEATMKVFQFVSLAGLMLGMTSQVKASPLTFSDLNNLPASVPVELEAFGTSPVDQESRSFEAGTSSSGFTDIRSLFIVSEFDEFLNWLQLSQVNFKAEKLPELSLLSAEEMSRPAWFPAPNSTTEGEFGDGFNLLFLSPNVSQFKEADWVRQKDLRKFKAYSQRRMRHDEYRDYGKLRSRDVEYVYRIYLKGGTAEYLDTSEKWWVNVLGGVIEQVDGVSTMLKFIEESFLEFNLFKPTNPFKKFNVKIESRNLNYAPVVNDLGLNLWPSWKWKGDISLGVGSYSGGLDVEEVVLQLGRLKFSEDFVIKFDLFYVDEGEYSRTGP